MTPEPPEWPVTGAQIALILLFILGLLAIAEVKGVL